ncbi:hypothetical protein [Streptomyces sp. CT34]|uniref:hypothetical protein n=1 Tax=Streptomyces sp. CT34 TaxID=1553907 RepID=UPI0005BB5360|nr:hypothetical protein [Streptomyces sp. CT34]
MKTCARFERIKNGYEQDIACLRQYAAANKGTPAAKANTTIALTMKGRMARALVRHFDHCPICG